MSRYSQQNTGSERSNARADYIPNRLAVESGAQACQTRLPVAIYRGSMDRWMLVLTSPTGDPGRVVAGLPLVVRLALDAQAGGMEALVLPLDLPRRPEIEALLGDPRLRLPIHSRVPEGVSSVQVPANWLVHRLLFRHIVDGAPLLETRGAQSGQLDQVPSYEDKGEHRGPAAEEATAASIDLTARPLRPDMAFSFSPIEVVDGASARRAARHAFRALRKPEDGWTARWLNRYISLALSRLLVRTPLTPNQVSIGILAVGLAGAYLACRGDRSSLIVGAFLFQMQSVLDGCDGEMSRITYQGSLAGQWLDTVGDDLTNYSFFFGAAWGLYQTTGWLPYLVAGLVVVGSGIVGSGLEYRYLIRIGSGDLLKYPLSMGENQSGFLSAIQPLFKRDTFVFLTFLAALCGLVGPMLIVFAAGAVGILVNVIKTELRLARQEERGTPAT